MKSKTVIVFTGLVIFGFLLPSCFCNCRDVKDYFIIHGANLEYRLSGYHPLNTGDTVTINELPAYTVSFDVSYVSDLMEHKHKNCFSLISSAYACDCPDSGGKGAKYQYIKSLSVVTQYDFDADHLAKDTINDLFFIRPKYYRIEDLNVYLSRKGAITNSIPPIERQYFDLVLKKPPLSDDRLQVEVILELNTGEVFRMMSEQLVVKP